MTAQNFNIINALRDVIVNWTHLESVKDFCSCHGISLDKNAFTRTRSMPLSSLLAFLLTPRSKSMNIELLWFSHLIGTPNVNKSDLSKRRSLINWNYFADLACRMTKCFYACSEPALWHGHLILAGDGTTYSIPNTQSLIETYLGDRKTGIGVQALARGVVLKDTLNDWIVASDMECYGQDEIHLLCRQLDNLPREVLQYAPVVILDRKYCAYTMLEKLQSSGLDFIIRVKERFSAEVDDFIHSADAERTVILQPAPTTVRKLNRIYGGSDSTRNYTVRLVRLSDQVVVMTSLKENLKEESSDVYHLRWDDESTIGFMKNNLQVEVFSGLSKNSLMQDFNSKTICYNLLSAIASQAAELHHGEHGREKATTFRINRNVALGILCLNLPTMLVSSENFSQKLNQILKEMGRFTTRIVPHRHNPRAFRKIKHSGKYITLTNYARAI